VKVTQMTKTTKMAMNFMLANMKNDVQINFEMRCEFDRNFVVFSSETYSMPQERARSPQSLNRCNEAKKTNYFAILSYFCYYLILSYSVRMVKIN
jgi:hypothetical protein